MVASRVKGGVKPPARLGKHMVAIRSTMQQWGIFDDMKPRSKGWKEFVKVLQACGVASPRFLDHKRDLAWLVLSLARRVTAAP